jgi:hypothetical protein
MREYQQVGRFGSPGFDEVLVEANGGEICRSDRCFRQDRDADCDLSGYRRLDRRLILQGKGPFHQLPRTVDHPLPDLLVEHLADQFHVLGGHTSLTVSLQLRADIAEFLQTGLIDTANRPGDCQYLLAQVDGGCFGLITGLLPLIIDDECDDLRIKQFVHRGETVDGNTELHSLLGERDKIISPGSYGG